MNAEELKKIDNDVYNTIINIKMNQEQMEKYYYEVIRFENVEDILRHAFKPYETRSLYKQYQSLYKDIKNSSLDRWEQQHFILRLKTELKWLLHEYKELQILMHKQEEEDLRALAV